MDPSFIIVLAVIGVAFFVINELRRIEKRLAGSDDSDHDLRVDDDIQKAIEPYRRHRDRLNGEKDKLPKIGLYNISSTPDWEKQLMAKAEPLRRLIEESYGLCDYELSRQADSVRMTYELAYALASIAGTNNKIAIQRTEWAIKKIETIGLQRKRCVDLRHIAEAEQELLDIQREITDLEFSLKPARQDLHRAFDAALERSLDGQ